MMEFSTFRRYPSAASSSKNVGGVRSAQGEQPRKIGVIGDRNVSASSAPNIVVVSSMDANASSIRNSQQEQPLESFGITSACARVDDLHSCPLWQVHAGGGNVCVDSQESSG